MNKLFVMVGAAAAALLAVSGQAAAVADTNVTALIGNAEATFSYVLPIAAGILGIFLAIGIGVRVWSKVSRGRG